ncbi:MAG: hypothetical protein KDB49_06505, partial [Mycobacterium sp.]|nr:hypothetical protein [Mycobacterium sp.]
MADTVTDWPRYSGHAIAGVSGFGFGGANAHLVLREVLPSDLVEPEPDLEPGGEQAAPVADAVYVGGVLVEDDDEDELVATYDYEAAEYGSGDAEPELPGLTDEALELLEAARADWEAADQPVPVVPITVSGFLTSRKRATAAELADWVDGPAGRAASLESIGRSLSRRNHGRSRAVV